MREIKFASFQLLKFCPVEWLKFVKDVVQNGFHAVAVKACENALRCIGNDDVQPYLFVKMLCDKSLSAHRLSLTSLSLLFDLPEFSHLGWGH
ncbi:hypothetical protein A2U01_0036875, partial [Trifolium medium]|nr:hypothetical protein [Trifolium medium]